MFNDLNLLDDRVGDLFLKSKVIIWSNSYSCWKLSDEIFLCRYKILCWWCSVWNFSHFYVMCLTFNFGKSVLLVIFGDGYFDRQNGLGGAPNCHTHHFLWQVFYCWVLSLLMMLIFTIELIGWIVKCIYLLPNVIEI